MGSRLMGGAVAGGFTFMIGLWLVFAVCWVANVVRLIGCDFNAPYKGEIIHAVGVVVPPAAVVTVWFGDK